MVDPGEWRRCSSYLAMLLAQHTYTSLAGDASPLRLKLACSLGTLARSQAQGKSDERTGGQNADGRTPHHEDGNPALL